MQINQHNYEAYFLDFWENVLDVEAREALTRFLEANPGLHDEFLDFKESAGVHLMPDESIEFKEKAWLKKPDVVSTQNINHGNYEDYIIANIEGDLSPLEIAELEDFRTRNPQLLPEFRLYDRTKLKSDQRIVFKDKSSLRKFVLPQKVFRLSLYASVAAAALLLALLIVDPFGSADLDQDFAELHVDRPIPVKPLPRLKPQHALNNLGAGMMGSEPHKLATDLKPVVMPLGSREEMVKHEAAVATGPGDATREFVRMKKINPKDEIAILTSDPVKKHDIGLRTDLVSVFDDMLLRDALHAESRKDKDRSVFGRFLANLGDQILGNTEETFENSLIGQVAGMSRERISEIRENAPKIETMQTDDSKKTYFTINENFRIRISRDNKAKE